MAARVLVPLDGSDLAARAIPWARELATAIGADVELLEVVPVDSNSQEGLLAAGEETEALRRGRALMLDGGRVECRVIHGSPADSIVARAAASGAELIVMASHGRGGVIRAVLGSVTADVLRQSPAPVLVVRANLAAVARPPRRILVALDGTDLSESIIRRTLPLIQRLGATVVLCSVASLPPQAIPVQGAMIPVPAGEVHTPAERADYVDRVASQMRDQSLVVEARVGVGDPAGVIASTAADAGVDVIAMATHGRSGLERWALGSVTEVVIRDAGVPVLAVHPVPPDSAS
ncbi:MAG TPA: universal stress protein [Chloroflexota bacterium]|nr:universal stress protein [Chloroflexota bacterium]